MRRTATNPTIERNRTPRSHEPAVCASCESDTSDLTFGRDPDGFVLCRECRSPLFYCDIGGQG